MHAHANIVVMYHNISGESIGSPTATHALPLSDFSRQLAWLGSKYKFVAGTAFHTLLEQADRHAESIALLTFDDGYVDHYRYVFPLLKEKNLSGIFFIASATIGTSPDVLNVHKTQLLIAKLGLQNFKKRLLKNLKMFGQVAKKTPFDSSGLYRYDQNEAHEIKRLLNYELPIDVADRILEPLFKEVIGEPGEVAKRLYLSQDMIKEMARGGMMFGFHTKNHSPLSRLNDDEQYNELEGGIQLIRELTGQVNVPFCFPFGHRQTYNKMSVQLLKELGYSCAFNTVRSYLTLNGRVNRFELPRFDAKDLPPFVEEMPHA